MAEPFSTSGRTHWRDEGQTPLAGLRPPPSRGLPIFLLSVGLVGLVGALVGLLFWIRPTPGPHLVPLWIARYDAPVYPELPGARAEQAAMLALFPRGEREENQAHEQHTILRELVQLQGVERPVVVYLRAHAQVGEKGEVLILPSDARPEDPASRLPLSKVLELLRPCRARHRLLILDLAQPFVDPSVGILTPNVAAAIPPLVEKANDPTLLVLCSCAPGQVSHYSEVLGRSVFHWYLEQGLRGYADGYGEGGERAGRVTAHELTAFLRARVDRWVQQNRGQRQTPILLGLASKFPIRAFDQVEKESQPVLPNPGEYPPILLKAFKERQQAEAGEARELAPVAFREAGAMLVRAEQNWRGGNWNAATHSHLVEPVFRRLQEVGHWREHLRVVPQSLALETRLGEKGDETVAKAVNEVLTRLDEVRLGLKPDDAAKAQAKLVGEFLVKVKGKPPFVLRQAVFQKAVALGLPSPSDLRQLDGLLQPLHLEGQPEVAETLYLHQLAVLAEAIPPEQWPAELVAQALEVVDHGEKAACQIQAFPWLRDRLHEADSFRHQGLMQIWAHGYTAAENARPMLAAARQRYAALLGLGRVIRQAYLALDDSLNVLPFYPRLFATYPEKERDWREAVQVATAIYQTLTQPPPPDNQLLATLKELEQAGSRFREQLQRLQQPWNQENIARLTALGQDPRAGPGVVREIDALLIVPTLKPEDRIALWQAGRAVQLRLHQATAALDAEENESEELTPEPGDFDEQRALARQKEEGLKRGQAALQMLALGGLNTVRQAELQVLLQAALKENAGPDTLVALGEGCRLAWRRWLPEQLPNEPTPALRDRLSRIFSPWPGLPVSMVREIPLGAQRLRASANQLWRWLADWHRYLARDYQDCGLDPQVVQPLARFHGRAATNYAVLEPPGKERYLQWGSNLDQPRLTPTAPSTVARVGVRVLGNVGNPEPVELRTFQTDENWIRVLPPLVPALPLQPDSDDPNAQFGFTNLRLELKALATAPTTPRPRGVLLRASSWGRSFHRRLEIPLTSAADQPQLVLTADPQSIAAPLSAIRLRPGRTQAAFFLQVRNPSQKPRKVIVQVQTGGPLGKISAATLTVAPGEFQRVQLPGSGGVAAVVPAPGKGEKTEPPPPAELPLLEGPLQLSLLDGESKAVIETRTVPVEIMSPREYVTVTDIQFDPPSARNKFKNQLTMSVQPLSNVGGPDIPCELVLPPDRIPGLLSVKGGTFLGKLALSDQVPQSLTLFAQDIRLNPGASEDGYVYLHCDGYERCFIYRTTFASQGQPLVPRGDGQPAVRIRADAFVVNTANLGVVVEVDNAPRGSTLEVSLGRTLANTFQADATRTYPTPRQAQVGHRTDGGTGALVFTGSIRDWRVPLDASKVLGSRQVRARLLDRTGLLLGEALQTLMIDDTPPDVHLIGLPLKVKKGGKLTVKATGRDAESGIGTVQFFLGRLQNDKIPPAVVPVRGEVADAAQGLWSAELLLPDVKGPTPITVVMSNKAGLAAASSKEIDLVDEDPALTAAGTIKGRVVIGPLGQPNLDVTLLDDKGKEKAKVKTKSDGSFVFEAVPPGTYTIQALKKAARRKGQTKVTVEPGKTATVTLELTL